ERRVPGRVQRLQRGVLLAQPIAESGGAQLAVAGAAVLVADVPGDDGRVLGVPLCDAASQFAGEAAEDRRAWTRVVPLTVAVLASLEVRARHLGVRAGQPGGMGAGRGGQADVAALVGSALDDPVEHAEVVPVLGRLNQSPVEDAEGDGVDPGGVKELIVPGPDLLGPLLRV